MNARWCFSSRVVTKGQECRDGLKGSLWTPEAAFSRGVLPQVSSDLFDAQNKYRPTTVSHCRFLAGKAILDGQMEGCKKLKEWSEGSHMFDETKLCYRLKGRGYRHFSKITFKEAGGGIQDEDIIRTPEAMERYSAGVQIRILTVDPIMGIMPLEGSRPPARFRGTVTMSDSHAVNTLTVMVLREQMHAETLLCPCFCLQHPLEEARAKARAQKVREAFCSFSLSVGTEAAPCTRARLGVVAPRLATTTLFQSRGHVTTLKRPS